MNGGTHDAGEIQRVAANRATHALWKRCNEMDLANANILSYLYGTHIQIILTGVKCGPQTVLVILILLTVSKENVKLFRISL